MRPWNRSLNLANAVAIVVYEAWRQHGFVGAAGAGATTSETLTSGEFDR
jgi:tRNA (cytidine/uridine-2'-O-)-methyltransferase